MPNFFLLFHFLIAVLIIVGIFSLRKKLPTKNLIFEKTLFCVFGVGFILAAFFSLIIYTSLFPAVPWHEPCGMQFFAILICSAPSMLFIGFVQLFLTKYLSFSKPTKFIPFVCAVLLVLILFIDGGLGIIMQIIGVSICVISVILYSLFAVKDFIKNR